MIYSPEYAKHVADKICAEIRENGFKYKKRYTRMNVAGTALKTKLYWVDRDFWPRFEKTRLHRFFQIRHFRTQLIGHDRRTNTYVDSFVFWLPVDPDKGSRMPKKAKKRGHSSIWANSKQRLN